MDVSSPPKNKPYMVKKPTLVQTIVIKELGGDRMRKVLYLFLAFACILAGCKNKVEEPEYQGQDLIEGERFLSLEDDKENQVVHAEVEVLEVELINEDGVVIGVANLTEQAGEVVIEVDAHHLPPGLHGFHIHEKGLCEAPSFESAGGHFNPTNNKHGFDHSEGPHAGDLENIEVADDGTVKVTVSNDRVTLQEGEENSLQTDTGTSLILHAEADDYRSQPAGDSGDRIMCGVIFPPKLESDQKN